MNLALGTLDELKLLRQNVEKLLTKLNHLWKYQENLFSKK